MNWTEIITNEKAQPYFKKLNKIIDDRYEHNRVYPKQEDIFRAFDLTPFDKIKVVILGQDPYHGVNQAQGLAFSTPKEIKNPPSMRNILKEIAHDMKRPSFCEEGDLTAWAKEGVLLLNTILTVEDSKPKSHHKLGWEDFTDNIIKIISDKKENIVFILWGANAISKEKLIDTQKHHVLSGPHPSPLSAYRGFFGCKHFSQTNKILKQNGITPIHW